LTNFVGFLWDERRVAFVQAPNFGKGFSMPATAGCSVILHCTSGFPIYEPYTVDAAGQIHYASGFELTQDCVDAVSANQTQKNKVKQRIFETNFQGKILDLKSGELRGAFGATKRWDQSSFRPDPLYTSAVAAGGETNVKEIYGEILLPVTKKFELELGVRRSDFETVGRTESADTWKSLFNWTVTDSVRFRGGLQRAYRTPNVSELFSGPSSNPLIWNEGDPCRSDTLNTWGNVPGNPNRAQVQALCSALIRAAGVPVGGSEFDLDPNHYPPIVTTGSTVFSVQRQGNPDLQPELAKTRTFGIVWQAKQKSLTISADYYAIELEGAIDELTFQTVYQQCFNYNGTSNPTYDPSNQFCGLIRRNDVTTTSPGAAGQVQGLFYNIGARDIAGVDVDLTWRADLANLGFERLPGEISVRHSLNYSLRWKSTPVPGAPTVDYKGSLAQNGLYDYTPYTTFGYRNAKLNISLNWRYLPYIRSSGYPDNPLTTTRGTDSYNLFSLSGGWDFGGKIKMRAGIDNLFNADPEVVGATPDNNALINTNTGRYDPLGRRGFVGIQVDF
jgi:outer membrane receptor protein involved in Fe transport